LGRHYEEQGLTMSGRFILAAWPARIVSEVDQTNRASFSLQSGARHEYIGFDGQHFKVVRLHDNAGKESLVGFVSGRGGAGTGTSSSQPTPASPGSQEEAAFRKAYDDARAEFGSSSTNAALAALNLADAQLRQGKSSEAANLSRAACNTLRRELGEDNVAY